MRDPQIVNFKVKLDANGDPITTFALEGFVGSECKELDELENSMGSVEQEETDAAYQGNQELPLPNQQLD